MAGSTPDEDQRGRENGEAEGMIGAEGAEDNEVRWLRHAGIGESLFECGQQHGKLITIYCLTLASPQPLQPTHLHQALLHLYRQVPTLRLCLRLGSDGQMWACERKQETIDFQVIKDANLHNVMETALHQPFNSYHGPLWRAMWVPEPPATPVSTPSSTPTSPYIGHLVLANHHGIADGTSNVRACGRFIRILNDVLVGKDVCDKDQMEKVVAEEEVMHLIETKKKELEEDQERLGRFLEEEKEAMGNVPLLIQRLGVERKLGDMELQSEGTGNAVLGDEACRDGIAKDKTRLATEDLDQESTKKFIARCKAEGITVGSAVTAIIHGVTVDVAMGECMIRKREEEKEEIPTKKEEEFVLQGSHAVNLRRYMGQELSQALGTFMTVFKSHITTPTSWSTSFWDFARKVHHHLHQSLNQNGPLHDEAIRQLLVPEDIPFDHLFTQPPPPHLDITTSHMGKLDLLLPLDPQTQVLSGEVQITRVTRATSNWLEPFVYFTHTLRGTFTATLAYSRHLISHQTATTLMQSLTWYMRELA